VGYPTYFTLWAKTSSETEQTHPLIYHLIDVGQTTLALWKRALTPGARQQFSETLNLSENETGNLLAFWASLHDMGKAAPGFQRKYVKAIPDLQGVGFNFPAAIPHPAPHGQVSAWILEIILAREGGYTPQIAKKVSRSVGGHHGIWPSPRQIQSLRRQESDTGDATWDSARNDLCQAVCSVFQPSTSFSFPINQQSENALLTLLSGLVSVADWIGSMEEFFPYETQYFTPSEYAKRSEQHGRNALYQLGWIGWQPDGRKVEFTKVFPFIQEPSEIQKTVIKLAENSVQPILLILEAPTGSGKTETALYLADSWLQSNLGRGLYIAMPTQATSNQMYARVEAYLNNRYPLENINYHLLHGGALLSERETVAEPVDISDDEFAPREGGIRAQSWFLPHKRTFLAPFGVGTVDQALMSVLQTKHFFVRLFGLGSKVVIFDEIHAYDTYMSTLFERLLGWLRLIGASVILLSATLPDKTRQNLMAAWLNKKHEVLPTADYPRLTIVTDEFLETVPLPAPVSHMLSLEWIAPDPQNLAAHLAERLKYGGCAAVICNRVARAQEVYKFIKEAGIIDPDYLILFHARFPFAWREEIEKRVLNLFSKKEGQRPKKAIVVATQVIEQSLDLDFDYMITDLAPVDLLIQRAGRLHRHSKNDVNRPTPLVCPVLAIASPAEKDGLPDFGRDEHIYERSVLLRTWLNLCERSGLTLPQETSAIIEAVYDEKYFPHESVFAEALRDAEEKARKGINQEIFEAKTRLIPDPDDEDLLTGCSEGLDEDDPKVHEAFRALTRLAEPNVSLVCLHQTTNGLALEADGTGAPINLNNKPNRAQVRDLLRRVLSVQRRDVLKYFISRGCHPTSWKEVAALRYHYLCIFDEHGLYPLEGTSLTLSLNRETGLEILKEVV